MVNDIEKRIENLLTEINILKDKKKEIEEQIKSKEQELGNCHKEQLSLQQELTRPHQPRYDVSQIPSKYNTPHICSNILTNNNHDRMTTILSLSFMMLNNQVEL